MANSSSNSNSGLNRIAQQRLLRGKGTDANLINNFGNLGAGQGRQALNSVIRGKVSSDSNSTTKTNSNLKDADSDKKDLKYIENKNLDKKDPNQNKTGKSIMGMLGL